MNEIERLRAACAKQNEEICQTLGRVLGYPWFKDDQSNFPGATEAHGVCVGEHVAETLAMEAAREIKRLRGLLQENTPDPISAAVDAQFDALGDEVKAFGHKLASDEPQAIREQLLEMWDRGRCWAREHDATLDPTAMHQASADDVAVALRRLGQEPTP